MEKQQTSRSTWKSRFGFIMATSGAAIGLGNIQRFPYLVAEQGGAAFVCVYIACVLLLGIPLILLELSLGRFAGKNPVDSILSIKPKSYWAGVGFLGIATAFFIFCYYCVIAGWTVGYAVQMATGHYIPFADFAANPLYVISLLAIFLCINAWIVSHELNAGIERFSKIFIPLIFIIFVVLIAKCLTMSGCSAGFKFYLEPDWSKINWQTISAALSQAFFSLCIGEAVLITYGSYLPKKENIFSSAIYIASFDSLVALLAGLVIFPALFSFGMEPKQGFGLSFIVLPEIFKMMNGGAWFGTLFFLLLALAALTTSIALIEMPVSYILDRKWLSSRKQAVWLLTLCAFALGVPVALSMGASPFWSKLELSYFHKVGLLQIMDFIWGDMGMVITGLLTCIFVSWVWSVKAAANEISQTSPFFTKIAPAWQCLVKYIAPVIILGILSSLLWQ